MATYKKLKEPKREKEVRRLMEAGGSNRSVAKALGTKHNTIASYRYRKNIPSTHDAPPMGRRRDTKIVRSSVMSATTKQSTPPLKLRLPASEAQRCLAKNNSGQQCHFVREEDSKYCALPQHQALEQKQKKKPARH